MLKGIDVSAWQGEIDWKKVKGDGVDAVILKTGGSDDGFYTDSKFESNYKGAKDAGIKVGAYYFVGSGFVTKADGEADAIRFLKMLKGKQFDLPVYVDVEATKPEDKNGATNATIAFCDYLEGNGYFVGIYASEVSGFRDRLDDSKLQKYAHWVACYGKEKPAIPYVGWQYSSSGNVAGINGNVDMDEFEDLSETIISGGFNGYANHIEPDIVKPSKKVVQVKRKTDKEIAAEVLDGLWGNGDEREKKLTDAGYSYDKIQDIVNGMISDGYIVGKEYKIVTPYGLNVRKGPSKDYDIIKALSTGTKVVPKEIKSQRDSTWMKISDGWICAREGNERFVK